MSRRVLQLSLSADPLNPLDGGDLGGQQIVVRDATLNLQQQGFGVDVITMSQHSMLPHRSSLGQLGQVIRMNSAVPMPLSDEDWVKAQDRIAEDVIQWIRDNHREYQLVHSHFWLSGLIAKRVAAEIKAPWIHSPYKMVEWVRRPHDTYSTVRQEHEQSILRDVDAVIVPYLKEADMVHQWAPNVPLYVVAPGLDVNNFFTRDPGPVLKGLGLSRRPLAYVGHLDSGRGIREVLQHMRTVELPDDLVLLLIGGNRGEVNQGQPQDPELAQLANDLAPHLRFLGAMPHRAVAMYMATAQAVIAPNLGPTLGMAVIEALGSGTPVVGSMVPGIEDWIQHGTNGFLAPAGDVTTLWTHALKLWSDPQLAYQMGVAGYNIIHRNHRSDNMAVQLGQIYDEVVQGYSPNASAG